jgi:hypothetical protein
MQVFVRLDGGHVVADLIDWADAVSIQPTTVSRLIKLTEKTL